MFLHTRRGRGVNLGTMKRLVLIALLLTTWVVPATASDQPLTEADLVKRNGLVYAKFTDTPFTGKTINGLIHRNYKSGKLHGEQLTFFPNGQLEEKVTWDQNDQHGPYALYHENGEFYVKGQYHKDHGYRGGRVGVWSIYYPNGNLNSTTKYRNHEEHGPKKLFEKNGQLMALGPMRHGEKH